MMIAVAVVCGVWLALIIALVIGALIEADRDR